MLGVCNTAQNWERWLQVPLVALISLLIWTYLFLLYTVSKKKTKTKTLISIILLLSCPVVSDSLRPHGLQHARPLFLHHLRSLPKFMFIASEMPYSHLILWCPLLLLPSIFPSIRDFSNDSSVYIRWPKYWRFSFSISPSSEYSGLISLKIDWFDILAVQGTFRSLFQHHSLKISILWCSAFFTVQLSQPYMTTGKTTALTRQTFFRKVVFLLFSTLFRFVITFLPGSNCLLILWLQLLSSVILEPKKRKSVTASTFFPSICHAVNSSSWWWTGRPGVLWFMGSQRVRHDLATELKLTHGAGCCDLSCFFF